ncbi:MAG: TolC family protein [Candidatus Nitrohelix vancouverensis]|uniref:TolC family protein n=1 Tax=Candidatus Nitrohelix vancouverensis TaxID=2705534 RepID=A0A7T0G461_9BACT|nr:MAG: TolC family protein [Candidatus Nitrohelix vancouverensis]
MSFLIVILFVFATLDASAKETSVAKESVAKEIPTLEQAIQQALTLDADKTPRSSLILMVKDFYFQIQSKAEQLEVAEEVKEHFQKAVQKSEEKYDEGDEDISQSNITKLKLGLAGTLNDIYELTAEIQIAKLSLGKLLGRQFGDQSVLAEAKVKPVSFPFVSLDAFLADQKEKVADRFELEKAFISVIKSKNVMLLAKKNRKITRTLLVTEVANYDFGIGDSGDLFEALIIYTRVLKGYYASVYEFNLSVARLEALH